MARGTISSQAVLHCNAGVVDAWTSTIIELAIVGNGSDLVAGDLSTSGFEAIGTLDDTGSKAALCSTVLTASVTASEEAGRGKTS